MNALAVGSFRVAHLAAGEVYLITHPHEAQQSKDGHCSRMKEVIKLSECLKRGNGLEGILISQSYRGADSLPTAIVCSCISNHRDYQIAVENKDTSHQAMKHSNRHLIGGMSCHITLSIGLGASQPDRRRKQQGAISINVVSVSFSPTHTKTHTRRKKKDGLLSVKDKDIPGE